MYSKNIHQIFRANIIKYNSITEKTVQFYNSIVYNYITKYLYLEKKSIY